MKGALKYIITEAIDIHTGATNDTNGCRRKNEINYIHFYKVTFCNPDAALWWFNPSRPSGYMNFLGFDTKEFGDYLTFDKGQCHDNTNCKMLHGEEGHPDLGPWVGIQHQASDPRNPTREAYWYSIPGECPLKLWSGPNAKDKICIQTKSSGRCAHNQEPDGDSCIWSSEFLGQVNLDHLAGITTLLNPQTGEHYKNYEEYCLAGNVEFERDPTTYEMIQGLSFYKYPLNKDANEERVRMLLEHYMNSELYPHNAQLPVISGNAPCYSAVRACGDGRQGTRVCYRDESQVCQYCKNPKSLDCEHDLPRNWKHNRFPVLPPVQMDGETTDAEEFNVEDAYEQGVEGASSFATKFDISLFIIMLPMMLI